MVRFMICMLGFRFFMFGFILMILLVILLFGENGSFGLIWYLFLIIRVLGKFRLVVFIFIFILLLFIWGEGMFLIISLFVGFSFL